MVTASSRDKRALLIVNAKSRRGRNAQAAVTAALEDAGLRVLYETCSTPESLPPLISRMADQVDRVVIGGGDGTLNAAAPALRSSGLPLGIVPLGTANDLARTLGIPTDPVAAAQVVAAGRTARIDLGEVNGQPFFNVASIGFGADLADALTRDSKRRWGSLGYAVAALRLLRRMRPFTTEIVHGGASQISRTVHIAVGNGRHYGGGMTVEAAARIDDGRLHVFSLEVASMWRLLQMLPALRSGRHQPWSEIRTLAGEEIEIRTRRPRSVNTDGEITTRTPARFRVLPGVITVFVSG
jgi:YegS/Rv2252/BmrU family lipid kinase